MEIETFLLIAVGVMAGGFIAQVLLLFFSSEIFSFMDRLVDRVRKLCGL